MCWCCRCWFGMIMLGLCVSFCVSVSRLGCCCLCIRCCWWLNIKRLCGCWNFLVLCGRLVKCWWLSWGCLFFCMMWCWWLWCGWLIGSVCNCWWKVFCVWFCKSCYLFGWMGLLVLVRLWKVCVGSWRLIYCGFDFGVGIWVVDFILWNVRVKLWCFIVWALKFWFKIVVC